MISRRQIRIKVMQAIYAWYCTNDEPSHSFDMNLKDFADEIRDFERRKGDKGDLRLLMELFYDTIENHEGYDQLIQSKAENWELERIALIDRILMQMGISEMTHFEEIPIKVTINEYLEIAKKFSTPKSSQFINGILDSLYIQFKQTDQIQKSGRGLIQETLPKRRFGGFNRAPQGGGSNFDGPPRQDVPPRGYGNERSNDGPQRPITPKQVPVPKPKENAANLGNDNLPPGSDQSTDGLDDKKKRPRIRKNDNENI